MPNEGVRDEGRQTAITFQNKQQMAITNEIISKTADIFNSKKTPFNAKLYFIFHHLYHIIINYTLYRIVCHHFCFAL